MATVGGNQVSAFSTPVNGASGDADVVRGNDNTLRAAVNAHDADATIHIQSSDTASRPAAGTAGRLWVLTDTTPPTLTYDTGAAWESTANTTATGTVGPWYTASITGSGSASLTFPGVSTVSSLFVPMRAGSILGIAVTIDPQVRTAGSVDFYVMKNGVSQSATLKATLDGTTTQTDTATLAAGSLTFAAGDEIGVAYASSAWTPTAAAAVVWLDVQYGS